MFCCSFFFTYTTRRVGLVQDGIIPTGPESGLLTVDVINRVINLMIVQRKICKMQEKIDYRNYLELLLLSGLMFARKVSRLSETRSIQDRVLPLDASLAV